MQQTDAFFMQRCIELAQLGKGNVSPNPMVGAVLVYENTIIGEGWHQQYGGPHAEVNCLASVPADSRHLICASTLYVSLEPCAHFGKTPPCAQLIIDNQIPAVVIGCRDPFAQVNGKGIEILQQHGIAIKVGVLKAACEALNAPFFTFQQQKRPYIILKWAETADHFIAPPDQGNVQISNTYAQIWLHKLRATYDSFAVGANTALLDNPRLSNRLWPGGKQPIRILFDFQLITPPQLHLYDNSVLTYIFNTVKESKHGLTHFVKVSESHFMQDVLAYLYQHQVQSMVVEGGSQTLQSFIDLQLWDEAWIIQAEHCLYNGVQAPLLTNGFISHTFTLDNNQLIQYLRRPG
jgi:diaminohydroxyphosphoribosylaminopyrimidine deaminase/5-amino-6-(5-phosphoribosylamino)uracil reductase